MQDGEVEFLGEFKVALIVRGDGHDGSAAVSHHDVVGDPDGDFFAVDGVGGEGSGGDAGLFFIETALHVGLGGAGGDVFFDGVFLLSGGDF